MSRKKKRQKMMRAAAKAPNWVRHVAATKAKRPGMSFSRGAASEVLVIVKDGVTQ